MEWANLEQYNTLPRLFYAIWDCAIYCCRSFRFNFTTQSHQPSSLSLCARTPSRQFCPQITPTSALSQKAIWCKMIDIFVSDALLFYGSAGCRETRDIAARDDFWHLMMSIHELFSGALFDAGICSIGFECCEESRIAISREHCIFRMHCASLRAYFTTSHTISRRWLRYYVFDTYYDMLCYLACYEVACTSRTYYADIHAFFSFWYYCASASRLPRTIYIWLCCFCFRATTCH